MTNDVLGKRDSAVRPCSPVVEPKTLDPAVERLNVRYLARRDEYERSAFRRELLDLSSQCAPS